MVIQIDPHPICGQNPVAVTVGGPEESSNVRTEWGEGFVCLALSATPHPHTQETVFSTSGPWIICFLIIGVGGEGSVKIKYGFLIVRIGITGGRALELDFFLKKFS